MKRSGKRHIPYRHLRKGEAVKAGDEILVGGKWEPVHEQVGNIADASDILAIYRRRINSEERYFMVDLSRLSGARKGQERDGLAYRHFRQFNGWYDWYDSVLYGWCAS